MKHRGQIVGAIVRKSGYSLTRLAKALGVSRNTLYNRFENPNLGYSFIVDVGNIIHYDFSLEFPEMKQEPALSGEKPIPYVDRLTSELIKTERKYIALLERYTKLLGILVKLANENELHTLKKEIMQFMEEDKVPAP